MGRYSYATICLNGHVVSISQAHTQPFCTKCGKKTISRCKKCNTPIQGIYIYDRITVLCPQYQKPYYCHQCGTPYPWTKKILDKAVELLSLENEIDEETKKVIREAIPNLMTETPETPIAVAKYQNSISSVSKVIKDAMRQLLVDVVTESVKKLLFP